MTLMTAETEEKMQLDPPPMPRLPCRVHKNQETISTCIWGRFARVTHFNFLSESGVSRRGGSTNVEPPGEPPSAKGEF